MLLHYAVFPRFYIAKRQIKITFKSSEPEVRLRSNSFEVPLMLYKQIITQCHRE